MSWFTENGIDIGAGGYTGQGAPVSQAPAPVGQLGAAPAPAAPAQPWDRTAFRDAWMGSGVNTVQGMQQWLAANPQLAAGVTTSGSKGDVMTLPDGTRIDGVLAAGLGGGRGGPQWTGLNGPGGGPTQDGGGARTSGQLGGGQSGGSYGSSGFASSGGTNAAMPAAPTYTTFDGGPAFQAPSQVPGAFSPTNTYGESTPFQGTGTVPTPTQLPQQQTPQNASYNNFELPPGFVAPTAAEASADPGYQFRQQQAQQRLENSASAKGMSRTNNTWQALQQQAGDLASQEYGNVYGRRLGEAQMAYGNQFQANQANNQGNLAVQQANAQTGLAYGNANNAATQTNNANALAAQQQGYGQAANTYGMNQQGQQQQYAQQANTYGQNLAQQQQQYTQGLGTYQQNYANAANTNQMNNSGNLANYQAQVNAALGQGSLNLGYQNSGQQYALGQGNLGLGQAQLAQSANQFGVNQGNWLNANAFSQDLAVAGLGNPGAANAQQYGVNQGGVYGQIGNAQAAGQMGSANAYGQGAANLSNLATGALGYYGNQQPPGVMPGNY